MNNFQKVKGKGLDGNKAKGEKQKKIRNNNKILNLGSILFEMNSEINWKII